MDRTNNDIGKAFERIKGAMYLRYMGCLGEKVVRGIFYDGITYTEQGFKDEVHRRMNLIPPSINRLKNSK
jgi:hypothetical protein